MAPTHPSTGYKAKKRGLLSHPSRRAARSSVRLLLLVPFIGVFWVPPAQSLDASFGGLAFSYWYHLIWIMISALVVYVVYRAENVTRPIPG
jgi:hypothetical protein